eukprot:7014983-Heterocapsa_arctica.AAC.1
MRFLPAVSAPRRRTAGAGACCGAAPECGTAHTGSSPGTTPSLVCVPALARRPPPPRGQASPGVCPAPALPPQLLD